MNDLVDDESDESDDRKCEGKIKDYFGIGFNLRKKIREDLIYDKKYTNEEQFDYLINRKSLQDERCCPSWRREYLQADYEPLSNTISLEDIHKFTLQKIW